MKKNLKKSAAEFRDGRKSRRDFLNEVADLILRTPPVMGHFDDDQKHEFFAFIASKLEKIISRYREFENSSFETWFGLVLKRYFIYFIRCRKINKVVEINKQPEILDCIGNNSNTFSNDLKIDLNIFSKNEKKIIGAKYGIIEENNFKITTKEILSKIEQKRQIEDKISEKFTKLLNIRKIIFNTSDFDQTEKLKMKEQKILRIKRKLESKFNRINIFATNSEVAKQLGISDGTVASYINRIKNKLKNAGFDKIIINEINVK